MSIPVECQDCSATFQAKDEHAGRKVRCPECGSVIQIPDRVRRGNRSSSSRRGRGKAASQPAWKYAAIAGGAALVVTIVAIVAFTAGRVGQPQAPVVAQSTTMSPAAMGQGADQPAGVPATDAGTATSASPQSIPAVQAAAVDKGPAAAPTSTTPVSVASNSTPNVTPTPAHAAPSPAGTPQSVAANSAAPGTNPASTGNSSTRPTGARREPFTNLADLIEAVEPSVVRINVQTSDGGVHGSGFVVDTEGTIVTNRHVVEGASRATALFRNDKTEYPITHLYYVDEKVDLAVLKLDCPREKLVALSISDELPRKGDDLVALGAPLGFDFTATRGILSSVREAADLAAQGILGYSGTWLQHTVDISPGNSGGPLVNMRGELVGANTMTITIGQNLNFAISAKDISEAIQRKGSAQVLQASSVPARRESQTRGELKDIVGTEQAEEFLGQINTMEVIMLRLGFDPTRRVTATVRSDLEDSIAKAKIRVSPPGDAFMVVGMELTDAPGAVGTQAVSISAVVFFREPGKSGPVYKIWEVKEKVGTVAGRLFFQGETPKNLRNGIKTYFNKFTGAVNKAKLKKKA